MRVHSEHFHVPKGLYLLSHSIGARTKLSSARIQLAQSQWDQQGANAWPWFLKILGEFRQHLGALIDASPDELCPQSGVTSGFSKLLTAMPLKPSNGSIVMLRQEFPSLGFAAQAASKLGWSIDWVEDPSIETWERLLARKPTAALFTHVLYGNGRCQDIARLVSIAKRYDVFSIVDIAQSAGILPISLKKWSADAVIGSCVKWLCGGPGAGFIWVKKEVIPHLKPMEVGWFSHQNPFEFDIDHFQYADSAARFWGGTPSIWPFVYATAGIETLRRIGVETCYLHNQQWQNALLQEAHKRGIRMLSPQNKENRGGTLCLDCTDPERVTQLLAEQDIYVDCRIGYGIRISPHIYTELPSNWAWLDLLKP